MKKIIFGGIAIVAIAVIVAFNMNVKSDNYDLSSVSLENIEALANTPSNLYQTMGRCDSSLDIDFKCKTEYTAEKCSKNCN